MIKIDVKPIEITVNSITDLLDNTNPVLSEVGLFARSLILQKTARGVDWKGKKFKSYDPLSAKVRQKKELPTSSVDLFFTGQMINSIKVQTKSNTSRLYFASKAEVKKAGYHNAGDGVPMRHFFDLTPANVSEAQKIVTGWFDHGVK